MDQEFNMDNIVIDVDTDDVTLASLDNLRVGIRPSDVDNDDETRSTLASLTSIASALTNKSNKSTKSKSKRNNNKKQPIISKSDKILDELLPHMRNLALQQGNSAEAILLRKSLDALDQVSPPPEATAEEDQG